jgi:hypothetical protein
MVERPLLQAAASVNTGRLCLGCRCPLSDVYLMVGTALYTSTHLPINVEPECGQKPFVLYQSVKISFQMVFTQIHYE